MKKKPRTGDQILAAAAKTFATRRKVYGNNNQKVGPALAALFPNGLTLSTPEEFTRFYLFAICMMKLSRYGNNLKKGGHQDSVHDLAVYAAILESIDGGA